MKKKRVIKQLFAVLCSIAVLGGTALAAETASVMNGYTLEDSVVLYIKDEGQKIEQVFVGNEAAQSFAVEPSDVVKTVVLLDNSLSIATEYREDIKTFLVDLIAARGNGDRITIATFSEEIHYLLKDCSDYLEAKKQIEMLEFVNQDTYFNKTLYQILEDLEKEKAEYTRIIIIADGVENEKLGYTQEELNRKITEAKIPIYTLGCYSKGNEESLKQMFALSRLSNGISYLMDDYSTEEILRNILDDGKVLKLIFSPQEKVCDGSRQSVRVSFGEDFCQTDMIMPFREAAGETQIAAETEAAQTTEITAAAETIDLPDMLSSTEENQNGTPDLLGVIAIVTIMGLGILFGVILIIVARKKKREGNGADKTESPSELENVGDGTEILPAFLEQESNATSLLAPKTSVKLILQDTKQAAKSFEYPLRDKVVIGKDKRKCQIVVDYDGSVSGVHCEIFRRGDQYFVRDVGTNGIASTNGTYVDGQKATPELQLHSGAILKLGRVGFKVNFK